MDKIQCEGTTTNCDLKKQQHRTISNPANIVEILMWLNFGIAEQNLHCILY